MSHTDTIQSVYVANSIQSVTQALFSPCPLRTAYIPLHRHYSVRVRCEQHTVRYTDTIQSVSVADSIQFVAQTLFSPCPLRTAYTSVTQILFSPCPLRTVHSPLWCTVLYQVVDNVQFLHVLCSYVTTLAPPSVDPLRMMDYPSVDLS